jgi:hypothetical protein
MAAVGAVYTMKAFPRTAYDVVDESCWRARSVR